MSADTQTNFMSPETAKGYRPRFGLKTLFMAVTILCVMLGWRLVRRHGATAIVSRNNAVVDVLEHNMSRHPDNTSFVIPEHLRENSFDFRHGNRSDPNQQIDQLSRFFSGSNFSTTVTFHEPLVVEELLAKGDASSASSQIMKHYELGLADLGLHKTVRNSGPTETAIWQLTDHGVNVVIDVDTRAESGCAFVRIIFLHNERLSVW